MLHGRAAHSSRSASEYAYGDIFNQYVPLTVPSLSSKRDQLDFLYRCDLLRLRPCWPKNGNTGNYQTIRL